jgi:glycosyltransferase involved in cell wall biosynthesis
MKILIVHNQYRTSAPSGEDAAVQNEKKMLEARGEDVSIFERCNDDIQASGLMAKTALAVNTVWSRRSRSELRRVLLSDRPDIVHVHNTFAILSPSIYGACKSAGIPVVQTLHNFRFFCPSALFLRDGKPCEDCVDKSLLQSIRYRCYRGSASATATLAAMLAIHRALGTYAHDIGTYIVLTEFARLKAIKGGIPAGKLVVKPNFVPMPPSPGKGEGGYVLYVGRLLDGKGTETLIRAWRHLPNVKLKIVGEGSLRTQLEAAATRDNLNIEFAGHKDRAAVLQTISSAQLLIVPSEWYEGFPMVIAESFACGTPVLASRIGSLDELIEEGVTGRKFTPGNTEELADGVRVLLNDSAELGRMRNRARANFEANLTESHNYEQLMQIYSQVIAGRTQQVHGHLL